MTLQEKLDLWVQITGINPNEDKKKYTLYFDGRLSDYDIKKMNDRIKETLEDDETGMFAEAYLSTYLNKFLEEKKISLLELINNKELSSFVDDVKKLHTALKETNAEEVILNEAKKAMDFYKLPCNLNAIDIIELRTSAMRCMNGKLEMLQFSVGNNKADSFKLSRDIYMFDNLDALILCAAKGNLNGVTLGYIRDKEELTASFFAFIIKNGDNLYLLTDMPKYAHPVQKGMSRCPGRNMSERIDSNWFPYDSVANIDISDLWNSGRYGTKETKDGLSTVINESSPYAVIGNIESLSQYEAFWFVMMASLIKKRFYEEELPILPISYTKSMISSTLLEKNENALIVQNSLPSFELKEVEDIKETQDLEYEIKNEEYIGMYDYLAERYADKIDKSILNVISNTDKSKLIEDTYYKSSWGKKECYMRFLDLDNQAGTKEQIEYNLKWIARYNYAKAIKMEMKKDVEEKTLLLYDTIKSYITPRLEEIIKMHLRKELIGCKVKSLHNFESNLTNEKEPISATLEFNKWYEGDTRCRYAYGIPRYANKADMKCHFTGTSAGVVIRVNPRTAEELALVCGISVEELPEELQHYDRKSKKYTGNSILYNIDPFLSVLSDEFNTLDFDVVILLSKKKYLEFCTLAGVEAVKFWQNEHPVCHTSEPYGKGDKCKGVYKTRYKNGHFSTDLTEKCKKCKWYKDNIKTEEKN